MVESLSKLTNKPVFRYRALELRVTLDLDVYKAVRRLIVPAQMEFAELHKVLQGVFNWSNYHLYDFAFYDEGSGELITLLVPLEECLDFGPKAVLQEGHTLSEFFPQHSSMLYTYDMGDNWEHEIELVRVIGLQNYMTGKRNLDHYEFGRCLMKTHLRRFIRGCRIDGFGAMLLKSSKFTDACSASSSSCASYAK